MLLNDKAANPTSYWKMNVSLAKILFEHKTLSYAEGERCQTPAQTPPSQVVIGLTDVPKIGGTLVLATPVTKYKFENVGL